MHGNTVSQFRSYASLFLPGLGLLSFRLVFKLFLLFIYEIGTVARSKPYLSFENSPRSMASEAPRYSTKELSMKTWPDFEKLFQKPGGLLGPGVAGCWCMYNHRPRPLPEGGRLHPKARRARNRREKRDLVEKGCAHGVLVYSDGEPVGWCQYGPKEELPRVENRPGYRKLVPEEDTRGVWRITCFVVDKRYRRSGVASTALRAALEAIKRKGGGLVEAYPIARWGAYSNWFGTVSMFQREGFETVAPFGKSNLLMRKAI